MAWFFLITAGLFEVLGVTFMNQFHQTKQLKWVVFLAVSFAASFTFLSTAMETIPMGTAYAIWTGIGASGGALVGMLFFGESRDGRRILFIAMVLSATIGLKIVS